jgi:hypothetical protein
MNSALEADLLELRLNEQQLLKQSLEDKQEKIRKLEEEARLLRDLVNSLALAPRPQVAAPQAQRAQALPLGNRIVPRRWKSS